MAVPSNRSASPISSRRISQSRNSESNSVTRRSFTGNHFPRPSIISNPRNLNPVTPANSPAGFGRKNSADNLQACDEKENEKDQKVVEAARSPANGSKNFMAPTISAASKFTPSPRKKILLERNDAVRTSISLCEAKATLFSAISSEIVEDLDQPNVKCSTEPTVSNLEQKYTDLDFPRVSKSARRVTFLESDVKSGLKPETVVISSDYRSSVDLGSKDTSSLLDSPIIAPLDVDPSLPPYDPKTNFLSPRPKFLYYKPNPRIEVLRNKEKGLELGKANRIEGNFMLEVLSTNFSDTEEFSSEDPQKDSEDSVENVLSEGTEKEPCFSESINTFSHVMPVGIVQGKEGDIPANSSICHAISEENFEQEKEEKTIGEPFSQMDMSNDEVVYDIGRPKPSFLKILKLVSLLLILVAACVTFCLTFYPSMDTSVLDTLKSPKLPDASEIGLLTKENLYQLCARFKKLSFDSILHLSLLVNNLGRGDNFGHVQFMNLTYLEDEAVCYRFDDLQQNLAQIKDLEEEEVEEEEWEADFADEPTYPEMVSDDSDERELDDASELSTEELVSASAKLAELTKSQSSETLGDVEEEAYHADTELKSQENSEDELAPSVASADTDDSEALCYPFDDLQQNLAQIKDLEEEEVEEEEWEADFSDEPTYPEMVSDDSDQRELEDASELSTEELVSASAKLAELTKSQSSKTLGDVEEEAYHADTELKSQENSEDELAPSVASADTDDSVEEEAYHADTELKSQENSEDELALLPPVASADTDDSELEMGHSIVEDSSSEMLESPTDGSENKDPAAYSMRGIASLVSALVSATAFISWKLSKTSSNPNVMVHTDGLSSLSMNPVSAVAEKIFQSKSSYQNCATEVDVAEEESCSSEMSSFQKSSSSYCRKELIDANEVQSQDRKARKYSKRESPASSSEFSTGSLSYGSFTTYERISSKHANGDDEIMTPVRRSSRIRDQVTSP